MVDAILGRITDALAAGDRVELRGFGSFSLKDMPARAGRNPKTGVAVDVTAKRAVVFRTGREMRALLNPRALETPDQIVARMLKVS